MWHETRLALPNSGAVVIGMDSGGYEHTLIYEDGLWWFPDKSMYVYFVPVMWKYE